MKSKWSKILIAIVSCLVLALGAVVGIFADEWFKENHECEFETTWSYDETYHWHNCTDIICDEISDKAEHIDENLDNICDVCGYDENSYIYVTDMEQLKTAITENNADVIVLCADLDLKDVNENDAILIESGKHILDLNGHTIKGVDNPSKSVWHAILVKGNETELTIKDSSESKTGTIEGRCYGIQVSRGAKLTIESGNFICTQNGTYNQSVVVYGGELVINGGKFTSNVYETIYAQSYTWDSVLYENVITINNGEFNYIGEIDNEYALLYFTGDNQIVTINNGVFNNNNIKYAVYIEGDTVLVNNAEINLDLIYKI